MKVKGLSQALLEILAKEQGFKLTNIRREGNFVLFALRMATRTAEAPDAPYRKRGFSGRWTTAVCFHGHRKFYEEIFKQIPNALIVTCKRRWTSLADLDAHAHEVERANTGSAFNPQTYGEQCDCKTWNPRTLTDAEPTVHVMKQSDILRCKFAILIPDHYRADGSCKCDSALERKRMINEWEYSPEDFEGIPLRGAPHA
jgi:hypothetical protein